MHFPILTKLASKNLLRNKRRTTISALAIAIGLSALIFTDAIVIGMERNMINTATASFLGEGQIHRAGFRDSQDVELTINHLDTVVDHLKKEPEIEAFTLRTLALGMISSPSNINSVSIIGIAPASEPELSEIDEAIIDGSYLKDNRSREILLGSKLAEILEVQTGGRIVLTAASADSGVIAQEMFRIRGIFQFNVREMDRSMVFIPLGISQQMLGLHGSAHEIALKFTSSELGRDKDLGFWKEYSKLGNEAVGWNTVLPQLEAAFRLSRFSVYITGVILFGIVSLVIINTLFMSLHERMFEFGVVRAIGTSPRRVVALILAEAASLAVVSVFLGVALALIITSIVAHTGIDYRGVEISGVTIKNLLYPVMNFKQFIYYPLTVFIFTTLIALYPALYAAKLNPAEAMRKSL